MDGSKFVNKALIDENVDLEFSIEDKVIIGKPLPDDVETESIGKLILNNFNDFPDYVGQINVHTGEKTTFAEFKDRSIRCALWLEKQGIGEGDVVSTSVPLQNDDYVPVLATLFIAGIINPWPHRLTPLSAEYYFKLVQPKIMFAWNEGIDVLVEAAKVAQVDCKFVVFGKHSEYPSLSDLLAEQNQMEVDQFSLVEPKNPKKQVGALFFTSGTTSNPKAVMVSYETLVKNRCNYLIPRTHSNMLTYTTFSWNVGLYVYTMCIRKFLTRILHAEIDPEETAAAIENFKVNLLGLNVTMFTLLYKSDIFKKYSFSTLEAIIIAGSKPSSAILEESRKALPHIQISNTLGITDAGGRLTVQTKKCQTKNSIGRVVGSVQLKIVDPKSHVVLGANQEGELCFKLENYMIGYLNDPEETNKAIDHEGWFHTGDLGYYDENGEVWITDCLKHIIIFQSVNVSPTKIEEILLQHPAVADVAVVPVPHEIDNERPFAFVVKKPGLKVTPEELIELPAIYDEMMRLTGGVAFINEIPCNFNGKKSIKDLQRVAQVHAKNNYSINKSI